MCDTIIKHTLEIRTFKDCAAQQCELDGLIFVPKLDVLGVCALMLF